MSYDDGKTAYKRLSGRPDIWYAMNIEIHDYMEAWKLLQFAADESFVYNPTAMDLWFSVDGEIVKVPGGERVSLCPGWDFA